MDPRPFTLRQLVEMLRAKRQVMGELAAWQVAMVIARITGEQLNPATINPYRIEPAKSAALKRIEEWQARRRWRVIHGEV